MKPVRVLLIEDDDLLREIYELKLTAEGFTVEVAVHGLEGLEKTGSFSPDVILVDMMMPKMGGLEFLKAYAKVRPKAVKVLVFSNMLIPLQREEARLLGADDYLIKSEHTPASLVRIIHSHVR